MSNNFKWVRETDILGSKNRTWYTLYIPGKSVMVAYIDKTPGYRDYYAFIVTNTYNLSARLHGRFKYLNDAKKSLEEYFGLKRTVRKKAEYGIKGKLRPFGL